MLNKITRFITALLILACSTYATATQSYFKQWDGAIITGPIPQSNYQYYFEPQLRLIADPYVSNQLLLLGGLGYQYHSSLTFFTGPGWIINQSTSGDVTHEFRLWQQANATLINLANINLISRTRLEERVNSQDTQVAYRFRERLWVRIPVHSKYFFSAFDEIFFDLNHPKWVSPYFVSQNRAFMGVGYQLSNSTIMDAGYLNQFLHASTNQMDHVLLVLFTINQA